MKLPVSLTTVTTFSKILAMILFIAFPFAGFYLGMKYQQQITMSNPIVTEVQKTPSPIPLMITNPNSAVINQLVSYKVPQTWKKTEGETITLFSPDYTTSAEPALLTGATIRIMGTSLENYRIDKKLPVDVQFKELASTIAGGAGLDYLKFTKINNMRLIESFTNWEGNNLNYSFIKGGYVLDIGFECLGCSSKDAMAKSIYQKDFDTFLNSLEFN